MCRFDPNTNQILYPSYRQLQFRMQVQDGAQAFRPHVHVRYQDMEAAFAIHSRERLSGHLPKDQVHFAQIWLVLHQQELRNDWCLLTRSERSFEHRSNPFSNAESPAEMPTPPLQVFRGSCP